MNRLLTTLLLLAISTNTFATSATASLMNDIKAANKKLADTEQRIAKARTALSQQLADKQKSLTQLREQAALVQRLADENTLGLTQLQSRLDDWQRQSHYQHNLLSRFLRQTQGDKAKDWGLSQQLTKLQKQVAQLSDGLYPQWRQVKLVLPDGTVNNGNKLQVGPVSWFVSGQHNGLLQHSENDAVEQVAILYDGNDSDALSQLLSTGETATVAFNQAELKFDPTLDRVIAQHQQQTSAIEHLHKGGIWAIPIVAFALFALTIAILKGIQLFRLPPIRRLTLTQIRRDMAHQGPTTAMQQQLLQIAGANPVGQARDDLLFNELTQQKNRLDNWLGAIAITASVSPLLGLLGTVSGMIETFKMMTLFGSGDAEVVSGGIAQALITTELGLVVAIPALIFNALLSRRAKSYYGKLEGFALELSQIEQDDNSPSKQEPL